MPHRNRFLRRVLPVAAALVAAAAAPPLQAQNVVLALDAIGVDYHPETAGRQVGLTLSYRTGIPQLETCSDVDPEGVVLTLELPLGTSLTEESDGRGAFDHAAGTVRWDLGTLNRFEHCFGSRIETLIDIDDSVADGAILEATAVIGTTTAGDDPSDNEARAEFQGGMLDLEVRFEDFNGRCHGPVDQPTLCTETDVGSLDAKSSGRIHWPNLAEDELLGTLPARGSALALPKLGASGSARGGFTCLTPDACFILSQSVSVEGHPDVYVLNPNPFAVPLVIDIHRIGFISCSDNAAGFPGGDFVEDTFFVVDCIFPVEDGAVDITIDGAANECRVIDRKAGTEDLLFAGNCGGAAVPRASASGPGRFEPRVFDVRVDADGGSRIFGPDPLIIRTGYGTGNMLERVSIRVAGSGTGTISVGALEVRGESPIELLVTDQDGFRVGFDPDEEAIDIDGVEAEIAPAVVAEIPGSVYSGRGTEPQTLSLAYPEPGEYRVDVHGTGDGPYTVRIRSFDEAGDLLAEQTFTGEATAGLERTERFVIDAAGAVEVVEDEPAVDGDLDGDGDVDTGDFSLFLAAFGACDGEASFDANADFDADGCVTFVDYQTWYGFYLAQ